MAMRSETSMPRPPISRKVLRVFGRTGLVALLALYAARAFAQANSGELHLRVTGPSGQPVKTRIDLLSAANQVHTSLETNANGQLDVKVLPYGTYRVRVEQQGFAPVDELIAIRSSLPVAQKISLKLASVTQDIKVNAASTLLNPDQAGSVSQIGSEIIHHRLSSIPGRSLQDLVNSQPGWLYEGNAVLHPRGSEYQTQFVVDGIPLTDNRSPSFGPELEADDLESMAIYTAGIPADYGRKMGGVIELNTFQNAQPGFHGEVVLGGGSFDTDHAFAKGQVTWGKNTLGGSASGGSTDRYLNPVVPENYSNRGTLGDFSADYVRDFTANDRLGLTMRHELSRYDLPNEAIQQAAGQRQTADRLETMGIASWRHILSAQSLLDVRGMVRDNAVDFNSNPQSVPVEVFQNNHFREGYFKAALTAARGRHEWKLGLESDNTFLHEAFRYQITDATDFDQETSPAFAFAGERPDLEQSAFAEDRMRAGNWTISAGLRWDHYQLLVNKQALSPRLALARSFASHGLVAHFSYDRVFQTPSSDNILLSSSTRITSVDPTVFLRLPLEPSSGDYYEGGLTKTFRERVKLDVNYFRRFETNFADDDQIDNTTISFPIAFRKAIIYGAEGKIDVPSWRRFSGFVSYSYSVGNVWNPVTGGLFLGDNATAAEQQLTGHFPATQDQRNTVRGRLLFQVHPRFWIAGGLQFDSGLPFEFDGDAATVMAQYGPRVLDRINFDRGRIDPTFLVNASAGADVFRSEKATTRLQVDAQNLTNVLDVIDFGGLFSGNAIGPSRSVLARLTTTF